MNIPPLSHIPFPRSEGFGPFEGSSPSQGESLLVPLKDAKMAELLEKEENLFAHLHLGARAENTGFEGIGPLGVVGWVRLLLQRAAERVFDEWLLPMGEVSKSLALVEQLYGDVVKSHRAIVGPGLEEGYAQIVGEAERIGREVYALKEGESYLVEGGYSANPHRSHGMFYRFTKEPGGVYTIVHYNLGAGIRWHTSIQQDGGEQVNPFAVFSGVTVEELFFSSDPQELRFAIFASIFEIIYLYKISKGDTRFKFEIEDVWKAFYPLQHRMIDPALYYDVRMTPQRTGTCTKKSMNGVMMDLLRSRQHYRAHDLNGRLLSLVNYYLVHESSFADPSLKMSQIRFQLKEGALNLCQKLEKWSKEGGDSYPDIPVEKLQRFYATARAILERVEEAEKKVILGESVGEVPSWRAGSTGGRERQQSLLALASATEREVRTERKEIATPISRSPETVRPEELQGYLSELKKNGSTQEIEALFASLPPPERYPDDPYWSKVVCPMEVLSSVLKKYLERAPVNGSLQRGEQYNTLMMMLAAMHQLCWRYDLEHSQGLLQPFGPGFQYFEKLSESDPHLLWKSPEVWERYGRLLRYFKRVRKVPIFDYSEVRSVTAKKFKGEMRFYLSFMEKNPEVSERIRSKWLRELQREFHSLKLSDDELIALVPMRESIGVSTPYGSPFHETGSWQILHFRNAVAESLLGLGFAEDKTESQSTQFRFSEFSGTISIVSMERFLGTPSQLFLTGGKMAWTPEVIQELSQPSLVPYLLRKPKEKGEFDEGAHLMGLQGVPPNLLPLVRVASATVEPKTTIPSFCYKIEEDLSMIESPVGRALIEHLLFKPVYSEELGEPIIPLHLDLRERPEETIALLQKVFEKGFQQYFTHRSMKTIRIEECLFLAEIEGEVAAIYSYLHKRSLRLLSDRLLDEMEVALREENPLSHSKLAALSLLKIDRLLDRGKEEDWEEILSVWMAIRMIESVEGRSLYGKVKEKMERFYPNTLEHLSKGVLERIVKELGIEKNVSESWFNRRGLFQKGGMGVVRQWERKAATATFVAENLSLNLATGEIATDVQSLSIGEVQTENVHFQRVFRGRQLTVEGIYPFPVFRDTIYGLCRMVGRGKIQRSTGRDWLSYVSLEESRERLFLPEALLGGYCHWSGPDSMLLTDEKTGTPKYTIDHRGAITSWTNSSGESLEKIQKGDFPLFERFESFEYLLVWQREGVRTKIELPRYRTSSGLPLTFSRKEGEWVYEANPTYKVGGVSPIHHFPHTIPLVERKGTGRKVLIPPHKISSKGFLAAAEITIPEKAGRGRAQGLVFLYHEMTVAGGELTAENGEGWIRLAMIALAQKEYLAALRCLEKVTRSHEITPDLRAELRWILSSAPHIQDYSPNSCALRLRAFLLLTGIDPFTPDNQKMEEESLFFVYNIYLRGLHNVLAPLQLSEEMEARLASEVPDCCVLFAARKEKSLAVRAWKEPPMNIRGLASAGIAEFQQWNIEAGIQSLKTDQSVPFAVSFLSLYRSFKEGSQAQREEAVYRARWYLSRKQESMPVAMQSLLHFVYKSPEQAPDPISPEASDEEKKRWLEGLIRQTRERTSETDQSPYQFPFTTLDNPAKRIRFEVQKIPGGERKEGGVSPRERLLPLPLVKEEVETALLDLAVECLEPRKETTPLSLQLTFDPKGLEKSELPFQQMVEAEFVAYQEELEVGWKRGQEETPRAIREGALERIEQRVRELENAARESAASLEKEILSLVHRLPLEGKLRLQRQLGQTGFAEKKVTLRNLALSATRGEIGPYRKLLPHLSLEEIDHLHSSIVDYMTFQTAGAQFRRILAIFPKMEKEHGSIFLRELSQELEARREYNPRENIEALYFEFVSGFRLRRVQAVNHALITKNLRRGQGHVFQMIQGVGKSAVMLSRLLELASEEGNLGILVSHHSQVNAARGNMTKFQRDRYEKDLVFLHFSGEELNRLPVLRQIEKKMEKALKEKNPLLMESRFVQSLQLQLLLLLIRRTGPSESEDLDAKIEALQRISLQLLTKGIGFPDEVDLTLNILQRVNFPLGGKVFLARERIHLVFSIYEVLASPEVDAVIGLSRNQQKDHSEKDYLEIAVPAIVKRLKGNPKLLLPEGCEDSLTRYFLGKDPEMQERVDRYVESTDLEQQEAGQLLSLARGMVQILLPSTLRKSYNRDYGKDLKWGEKVVPYLAAGVPADTEFGYVYEHLCYVFQSALNAPIPESSVVFFIETMTYLANHYVEKGEIFDKTAEAAQFFQLTGIPLSRAFEGKNVSIIAAAINGTMRSRLVFQCEIAALTVSYYASFLGSSPLALVDQFKTVIGCSGTVANIDSFHQKVSTLIPDRGAEGKILSTLLARYEGGAKEVRTVSVGDLAEFVAETLDFLPGDKGYCLFDGNGILKQYDSFRVAQEILSYYEKKEQRKRIQAVIFYYRTPQKEGFALLKMGTQQPIFLENTTNEEVEKHGVGIENRFVYLDELRSTGSDYTLLPDARGAGTTAAENLRSIGQMLMRLRNLFGGQDIDVVMADGTRNCLLAKMGTMLDVIQTALKNQAIDKAPETYRSYTEQIPNTYRTGVLRLILESSPEEASRILGAFRSLFETKLDDNPYNQFGRFETKVPGVTILEEMAPEQREEFAKSGEEALPQEKFLRLESEARTEVEVILAKARTHAALQCSFPRAHHPLGLQLQTNIAVELEQEQQLRVSVELREEERGYDLQLLGQKFEEVPWKMGGVRDWNPFLLGPEIVPLVQLLCDADEFDGWVTKKGIYKTDYSSCFPSNFFVTENVRFTTISPHPIFHRLQKSPEHLLIRRNKDGGAETILLSQKDAAFWISLGRTPRGLWLMSCEGDLLVPGEETIPGKEDILFTSSKEEGLWHANFFNGHITYLEKQGRLTQIFFQKDPNRRARFLYLKTSYLPHQRKLMENSLLFTSLAGETYGQMSIGLRRERGEATRKQVGQYSAEEVQKIGVEWVSYLPDEKVCFLSTPEQIGALLPSQINHIGVAQANFLTPPQIPFLVEPALIQALESPLLIKRVTRPENLLPAQRKFHSVGIRELSGAEAIRAVADPELIGYLEENQVEEVLPSQVPSLDPLVVAHLKKPEQIRALAGKSQINAIDSSALPHLTEEQIAFLRDPRLLRQLSGERVPHVAPDAVPHLDVLKQGPYLIPSQYPFVGCEQMEILKGLTSIPANLAPLWAELNPAILALYSQILFQCERGQGMPGMTFWRFRLEQMKTLTDDEWGKVSSLELSQNQEYSCTKFNEFLFRCRNLQHLELNQVDLAVFNERFSLAEMFPKLAFLRIKRCKLETLPSSWRRLPLVELEVTYAGLRHLPEWIGELQELTMLDLVGNEIERIPDSLCTLSNLKRLYLEANVLSSLPADIGKLTKLYSLCLAYNRLSELPESIGDLKNLNELVVYWNQLTTLPASVGTMKINRILACHNKIVALPDALGALRVERLTLAHNPLREVPSCVSKMSSLKTLELQSCRLEELPQELAALPLEWCNISGNPIRTLPENIGEMQTLSTLIARGTKLESLPSSLNGLPELRKLYLSYSPLHSLVLCPSVRFLEATGIPLKEHSPDLRAYSVQGSFVETEKFEEDLGWNSRSMCAIGNIQDRDWHYERDARPSDESLPEAPSAQREVTLEEVIPLLERIEKGSNLQDCSHLMGLVLPFIPENAKGWGELAEGAILFVQMVAAKVWRFVGAFFGFPTSLTREELGFPIYSVRRRLQRRIEEADQFLDSPEGIHRLTPQKQQEILARGKGRAGVAKLILAYAKGNPLIHRADKVLTNLFLDKSWVMTKAEEVTHSERLYEEGLYGFPAYFSAALITDALRKIDLSEFSEKIRRAIRTVFLPVLDQATVWAHKMVEPGREKEVAKEVLEGLRAGEPLLVPIGTKTHNFFLYLQREKSATFTLKVINTGYGLSHHARWGIDRMFETKTTYKGVPLTSLSKRDVWEEILAQRHEPKVEKVSQIYLWIGKLTEGGTRSIPSKDPLDYSSAQLQGTCAASAWWNWLRHEVVEVATEKRDRHLAYAEWRLLKHRIREAIHRELPLEGSEEKIRIAAENKLQKHGETVALLAFAREEAPFTAYLKVLQGLIDKVAPDREKKQIFGDFERQFDEFETVGQRWEYLRTLLYKLASEIGALSKQKEFMRGVHLDQTSLIPLHLQDRAITKESLLALFQDATRKKNWPLIGYTLGRLAIDPKLGPLAVELSKKWLLLPERAKAEVSDQEGQQKAEVAIQSNFFYFVTRGIGQERALRTLASHFRKKGKSDLAKMIWGFYLHYAAPKLADQIYDGILEIDDIALLVEAATAASTMATILFALREQSLIPRVASLITTVIEKGLAADDKEYSTLKRVVQNLYLAKHNALARRISLAVQDRK